MENNSLPGTEEVPALLSAGRFSRKLFENSILIPLISAIRRVVVVKEFVSKVFHLSCRTCFGIYSASMQD
ncbi:hypothetical protein [Niabella aurantiaca]|uniref:hypothetical protein n=1 Tax=Niabella aurantiaca TaxID=379900 RepID=UPI00036C1190|nr:hypothetical protein [Niabella aurantiaca]